MFKTCSKCNTNKPTDQFYWDKTTNRFRSDCKSCCNRSERVKKANLKYKRSARGLKHVKKYQKNVKKYQKSEKGRLALNKASKVAYLKHKWKWIARAQARYAVKIGKLIKPNKCESCHDCRPLQGHHEDYTKPLEVIWLCSRCHKDVHFNRLKI